MPKTNSTQCLFVFSVPKSILTAVNTLVTDSKSSIKQNDGTYHQKNTVCCFPLSLIEIGHFPTAELGLREVGRGNGSPAETAALPLGGQRDRLEQDGTGVSTVLLSQQRCETSDPSRPPHKQRAVS